MAAAGTITAPQVYTGVRPVNLRRDLADIADLIEYCFAPTLDAAGRAAIQEMRFLSRSGLVWMLGGMSHSLLGAMQGFVWLERGRLVGNVSVSPTGYGGGWIIANVAVHPDFRRQGIARHLMHTALEQVTRRGKFAVLQVEADNPGARALYDTLGFREQRIFTRWRRMTHQIAAPPTRNLPVLRRLGRGDRGAVLRLAEAVRPDARGGMGWLRPTQARTFRLARWGGLFELLSRQSFQYWGVDRDRRDLDAALLVETRLGLSTVVFDLLVSPARQGELEEALIYDTVRYLGGRLQPLVTEHPADDSQTGEILRAYHFRPERTLVHMIWPGQ